MKAARLAWFALASAGACWIGSSAFAQQPASGPKEDTAVETPEGASPPADADEPRGAGIPEALKVRLASPDAAVRAAAVQKLKRGGAQSLPFLQKAFSDPDESVRATAVSIYATISGPDGVAGLMPLAADSSTRVLHELLRATRDWNTPPAIALFLKILKEGNPAIRPYAIGLLEGVTDPQVIPSMLEMARSDSSPNVRRGAFYVLRPLRNPDAARLARETLATEKLTLVREAAMQTLSAAGCGESRPALGPLLGSKDTSLRQLAANFLAATCQAEATPEFVTMLGWKGGDDQPPPPTPPMEVTALQLFTRHPSPTASGVITERLTDPDQQVRRFAVAALGALGGEAAAKGLMMAAADKDAVVRSSVMEAFGRVGGSSAAPVLLAGLGDTATEVRLFAARSLGALHEKTATPALLKMLAEKDPVVRAQAAESLGMMGDPLAAPSLITATADADLAVREAAVIALGALGSPKTVEVLIRLATDSDMNVRLAAVKALGRIPDERSRKALEGALKDADAQVRAAARAALKGSP